MMRTSTPAFGSRAAVLLLLGLLGACGINEIPPQALVPPPNVAPFSSNDALRAFDSGPESAYRIGEGDLITLQVWDHSDLSGSQTVGPDGVITIPVAGSLKIAGMTRDEAAGAAKGFLLKFYKEVSLTIRVDQYVSNHIFVLGRVRNPGAIQFTGPPTLLEALSRAGGVYQDPLIAAPALSHCAIIRGRDKMAWIDLRRLMESGDLSLNINLKPNDLILVPEWEDTPVYVLGQVARPGLQRWTPGMTFMDAIGRAGGLTVDATTSSVIIARPSEDLRFTVSLDQILWPDGIQNAFIKRGDIVYVPMSAIAEFGYIMSKLNPFSWIYVANAVK